MGTRTVSNKELEFVKKWLDNNQDSRSETITKDLEEIIAKEFQTQKVICTNSAMGSLHLALQTIGVGPGDEVIVDPIVVFGGMAVMYQNAVPVFADIDSETYNIILNQSQKELPQGLRLSSVRIILVTFVI